MAIVLEEKKSFAWGTLLMVVLFVIILSAGAYYLFFAASPGIEVIIPREQKNVSQLSQIKLDASSVILDPVFQTLRQNSLVPSGTLPGNLKPFVKF